MRRFLLTLALLAFPSAATAQVTFDQVSGVFRAAITLSDLPWGGTRIDLKVQNTQGPGEAQAIVQSGFFIDDLHVESRTFFDEFPGPGTLHGGAVLTGASNTAVGGIWSASVGWVDPGGLVGFWYESWVSIYVAGCTPLASVTNPYNGEVVYGGIAFGYVQTCGHDAYLEYTIDVPHVVGTPTFSVAQQSVPALVTPEPASLALLATGLVGISGVGILGRRPRGAARQRA